MAVPTHKYPWHPVFYSRGPKKAHLPRSRRPKRSPLTETSKPAQIRPNLKLLDARCNKSYLPGQCRSWVKSSPDGPEARLRSTPNNGHPQTSPVGPVRANTGRRTCTVTVLQNLYLLRRIGNGSTEPYS